MISTRSQPTLHLTSDVADALGSMARCIPMVWLRLGGRRVFHGQITTIRCDGNVGAIRERLEEPGAGRLLVVDANGERKVALVGDKMASLAAANGWTGLIVHGAVRDADKLESIDLGLYALATVAARGSPDSAAERDIAVELEGVTIYPGDYAFCDGDGIVICDAAAAGSILKG